MPALATTQALRGALAAEWQAATRTHAFLVDVNGGAIAPARFNTWLAQVCARCFGGGVPRAEAEGLLACCGWWLA